MPFVEEKISEADRAKIDWSRFKSFGKLLDPLSLNKWIIDRDRSIFVIRLGSDFDDGEWIQAKAIYYKKQVITYYYYMRGIDDPSDKKHFIYCYDVYGMSIPIGLFNEKEQIYALFQDALKEDGRSHLKSIALGITQTIYLTFPKQWRTIEGDYYYGTN